VDASPEQEDDGATKEPMRGMKYRGKTELLDRLAAEYVLGTLRGRARQRFEGWMRDDAALRRTVHEWEERLAPLAEAVAPVRPPRRLWRNIEARIDAMQSSAPANAGRRTPAGWRGSLAFWRNWGLASAGLASALVLAMAFWVPQRMHEAIDQAVAEALREEGRRMQPSYIAVLEDAKGNVTFVAYAARTSDELWIKDIGLERLSGGRRYELWGLSGRDGVQPRSLGLVPMSEKGTIKLAAVADKSLSDFPKLAISLESSGGSSTGVPTGPVMYVGNCHKFW